MLPHIAIKKCGGYVMMDTNGKQKLVIEATGVAAPNVQNKDAKRKILDKKISVIVCTVFAPLFNGIQIIISIQ